MDGVLDWSDPPTSGRPTLLEALVSGPAWLGMGGSRWAATAAMAIRTLPLLLVVAALAPALVLCPFLGAPHRRWVLSLLALIRDWATAPADTAARAASDAAGTIA